MFTPDTIVGVEELNSHIPENLQYWYKFGFITEFRFYQDIDDLGQDIKCIRLVLTDKENKYLIGLTLQNISGQVRFDSQTGFGHGFDIIDNISKGWENSRRYRLCSFEMDSDPNVYCEKIKAELIL